jgi:hypothetical protein
MAVPPPVVLMDELAEFERAVQTGFHRLETRIQNLESRNHELENRVHALEMENLALERIRRRSTISDSMDMEERDPVHQMVEARPEDRYPGCLIRELYSEVHDSEFEEITEDPSPAGDLSPEHEIDESSEPTPSPAQLKVYLHPQLSLQTPNTPCGIKRHPSYRCPCPSPRRSFLDIAAHSLHHHPHLPRHKESSLGFLHSLHQPCSWCRAERLFSLD